MKVKRTAKQTVATVLALAGTLALGEGVSRAEPVSAGGSLKIFSSSGETLSISTRPRRRDGDRTGERPRKRKERDGVLLRAHVGRRESRVAHVVHITGNGRLNMTRSRTYVKGYRVEDGFLIPVLGTLTDGVRFGVRDDNDTEYRSSRPDRDYLLRDPRQVTAARREPPPPPEPTIVVERGPIGPHTTSLVGTLKRNDEGELEFLAATPDGEEVRYEMLWSEPAREVLAKAGTDVLRVILIGKVNDEDPRAVIRVTAAYPLADQAG